MTPDKFYRKGDRWAKVTRIAQGQYSIARGFKGEDVAQHWEVLKITKRKANAMAYQWVRQTGPYTGS